MSAKRCVVSWLVFLLAWLVASRAGAAEQRIVVVDVRPAAGMLDEAKLRAAIARELGASVLSPDDARAPDASGSLTVDVVDGDLVVSYVAHHTLSRHVPIPATPAATSRAAVLLAGNLARDEASDLASALRKDRRDAKAEPPDAPSPALPPPQAPPTHELDGGSPSPFHLHGRVWSSNLSVFNVGAKLTADVVPNLGAYVIPSLGAGALVAGTIDTRLEARLGGGIELGVEPRLGDFYLDVGLGVLLQYAWSSSFGEVLYVARLTVGWQPFDHFGVFLGGGVGSGVASPGGDLDWSPARGLYEALGGVLF